MNNLIAIAGPDNSGKTTLAKILQRRLTSCSPQYIIKNFAGLPAKHYEEITGINFHKVPREDKELYRKEFIDYCEGCKKIFGDSVWSISLFRKWSEDSRWIIDDLRFMEEYAIVKRNKGIIVGIEKDGVRPQMECDYTVKIQEDLSVSTSKIELSARDLIKNLFLEK